MQSDAVSPIPPPGWQPPPWLADVGWHPRELAWLAASLHERCQRLGIENRQLRGFAPIPEHEQEEPEQMTLPLEFHVSNPIHRQRLLAEGGTIRALPARMRNPVGPDITGIVLVDASGSPRVLADLTAALRLYDQLGEALGLGPELTTNDEKG